jgi:hypothetical protein
MTERLLGERSTVWQAVYPEKEGRNSGDPGYALGRDARHLL